MDLLSYIKITINVIKLIEQFASLDLNAHYKEAQYYYLHFTEEEN